MGLINQQAFTSLAGTILYAFLRFFPTLRVRRLSDGVTSYKRARNSGMEAQTGEDFRCKICLEDHPEILIVHVMNIQYSPQKEYLMNYWELI